MKKIYILQILTIFFLSFYCITLNAKEFTPSNYIGEIKNQKFLSDTNNRNRFILYEAKNCGYLIYDTISSQIIEYSKTSVSPYLNYSNDLFYFGPTNYVHKELCYYIDYQENKVELEKYRCISTKISSINNTNVRSGTEVRVENSFYFEKLDGFDSNGNGNNYFPSNVNGDCGYVAATILLSYYDTFYNDNIIYSGDISPVNNTTFNTDDMIYVPCATMAFKNHLHTYSILNATWSDIIKSVVDQYIEDCTIVTLNTYSLVLPLKYQIEDLIEQGKPPILFGNFQYNNGTSQIYTGNHAIIAYGYDSDFLICHFGWKDFQEIWINYQAIVIDSLTGTIFYMDIPQHVHSENIKINGHAFCLYDNYHISAESITYQEYSPYYHKKLCSCGRDYGLEAHEMGNMRLSENSLFAVVRPWQQCIKCGYVSGSL